MGDTMIRVDCPCCGATLEIDAETQTVIAHEAPKKTVALEDLREAVKRLKSEETTRDERFRKQFQAARNHEKIREKRFEGLLKKARSEGPPQKTLRDIDLD